MDKLIGHRAILDSVSELFQEMSKEGGRPVSIAVVDSHADLLHFTRLDGAPERSILLASNKAYTAARWGRDSVELAKMLAEGNRELSWYGDSRLTAIGGGVVIRDKQKNCIGAVGVSGRTMEEDMALASRVAGKVAAKAA